MRRQLAISGARGEPSEAPAPRAQTEPVSPIDRQARSNAPKPRVRIHFLDGLRGFSALYVTVFHAFQVGGIVQAESGLNGGLVGKLIHAAYYVVFSYGYCAVPIFIVLSGYSLMLPVARSAKRELPGGFAEYVRRRARRILPPYLGALCLSLAVIGLVPGMNTPGDVWWTAALPAFDPGAVISHLLLLHNMSADWISKINMPMWSVAVEWQIYFLLPAVLLPMWRRFGAVGLLLSGMAIGLLPRALFGELPFRERFFAMFAMGAFAACIGFSREPAAERWRGDVPWRRVAIGAGAVFVCLMLSAFRVWQHSRLFSWFYVDRYAWTWFKDCVAALGTAALIIHYVELRRAAAPRRAPLLLRGLESGAGDHLGRFSYSLYLTHAPILSMIGLACYRAGIPPVARYVIVIFPGTALALGFAWLFYLVFERPFTLRPTAALAIGPGSSGQPSISSP